MTRTSLVLTLIGDDRPGIVEQLADHILAAGANWEESRMARLAGKFTGLLRVSVDSTDADALARRLSASGVAGLKVVVESSGATAPSPSRIIRLELVGHDQPGIVRTIARVLANHGVNIEELETDTTSAPMSGDTLFQAQATLSVPASLTTERLRLELESLAGELMVDLTLDEQHAS